MVIIQPPIKVPKRIDTKVPIPTWAFPAKSSFLVKCCGIIEYYRGPKNADGVPKKKRMHNIMVRFCLKSQNA